MGEQENITIIKPTWPSIPYVHAFTTTKHKNINGARKDDRDLLFKTLGYPSSLKPFLLKQIHSNLTVRLAPYLKGIAADGAITKKADASPNKKRKDETDVITLLTADCLPILIAHKEGKEIAGLHAGWKGLLADIIENALTQCSYPLTDYYVWLGPAISQKAFEIGYEVYLSLRLREAQLGISSNQELFIPSTLSPQAKEEKRMQADLYGLARNRFIHQGVKASQIFGGDFCTFSDVDFFHSYRRDGQGCGHMATFIWLAP